MSSVSSVRRNFAKWNGVLFCDRYFDERIIPDISPGLSNTNLHRKYVISPCSIYRQLFLKSCIFIKLYHLPVAQDKIMRFQKISKMKFSR